MWCHYVQYWVPETAQWAEYGAYLDVQEATRVAAFLRAGGNRVRVLSRA